MNESDWIALIALAEATLLLTAALGGVIWWLQRRRKRDHKAASTLVQRLRKGAEERRGALEQRLSDFRGLDQAQAQDTAERIVAAEQSFSDRLIRTYLRRDSRSLSRMDQRLQELGNVYESIPLSEAAEQAEAEPTADRSPEVDRLRESVDNLSDEVRVYRDALNRLFAEYTAMFGVEIERGTQLTATEVLQRLDTGELGGPGSGTGEVEDDTDVDDLLDGLEATDEQDDDQASHSSGS